MRKTDCSGLEGLFCYCVVDAYVVQKPRIPPPSGCLLICYARTGNSSRGEVPPCPGKHCSYAWWRKTAPNRPLQDHAPFRCSLRSCFGIASACRFLEPASFMIGKPTDRCFRAQQSVSDAPDIFNPLIANTCLIQKWSILNVYPLLYTWWDDSKEDIK